MNLSSLRLQSLLEKAPPDRLLPLYDLLEDKIRGRCRTPHELVNELRLDGSNSLLYPFRPEGVEYSVVVTDVAEKIGATMPSTGDERDIELAILAKMVEEYMKKASPEEREEIEKILKKLGKDYQSSWVGGSIDSFLMLLLNTVGREAAQSVIKQVCTRVLTQFIAKQAAKRTTAVILDFAIPFVNVFLTAWLIIDIAGPAFRKTIPAVVQVALLRLEHGGREA